MKPSRDNRGSHFAKIVKWSDERGQHTGMVESQEGKLLSIFVFNKEKFGNRRTSREVESVEFC